MGAYRILQEYKPRASIIPKMLDLTNCPYMWPYCTQPLYHTAMPVMVNATILNGMGVVGKVVGTPQWKQGKNGHLLEVRSHSATRRDTCTAFAHRSPSFAVTAQLQMSFSYPDRIWPWTGWLGIYVKASEEAKDFDGEAEGVISVTVSSPAGPGTTTLRPFFSFSLSFLLSRS